MLLVTHPSALASVPRALTRLMRLRRPQAWALVLFCVDFAALGDLATGPDLWFGPVYLFVVCLAAWSLGWLAGQAAGMGCMALTFAINGISLYPYGGAELAANFAMRFIAVSIVVAVIAGVRRAYLREWWLARTDPLTGALNRQAFFELADIACNSRSWSLLAYADLDGFKQINDQDGHAAGDACLRAYAATVRKIIRRDDMFARVGGDEFLVYLAVKDQAAASAVAARLHAQMNAVPIRHGARARCSLGALVVPPGQRSVDELVRLADSLMYQAKLRGACLEIAVAPEACDAMPDGRARRRIRDMPVSEASARTNQAERRAPVPAVPERFFRGAPHP